MILQFCGIPNSGLLSELEHRSCYCVFDKYGYDWRSYINFCERRCNEDSNCNGYSYWDYERSCKFYTTSSRCSDFSIKGTRHCKLDNFVSSGHIGPIHTVVAPGKKGCFVKQWRKYLFHLVYQFSFIISLIIY